MKNLILLIGLLVGLGISQAATAYEWIDFNTVRVTFSYVEPTQNTDNSTLTDLQDAVPYYRYQGDLVWVPLEPIAASSPDGGGVITALVPVPPEPGAITNFEFVITARSTAGLESEYGAIQSLQVTRPPEFTARPKPVQEFAVQ